MALATPGYATLAAAAFTLTVLYFLGLVVYRLYLSPLARFPGPKLAAATNWYQKYFDLVAKRHGGQFPMEIKRMHEKYGPIVRIAPDELHIDDPEYWQEVYCNNSAARPIDKQGKLQDRFGLPDAIFSTPGAEQHRSRRQAMAGYFSKQRLRESQNRVNQLVDRVSQRLSTEYAGHNRVLDVGDMFSCLAVDIVTELCFRRCTNCTESENFKAPLVVTVINNIWLSHWNAHFRFLIAWIERFPNIFIAALIPHVKPILDLRVSINQQVSEILSSMNKASIGKKEFRGSDHDTVFDEMLASKLPSNELSFDRLSQEAMALTTAGVETVKATITFAVFHCLENPAIGTSLKAELTEAMPDPAIIPPWVELEKLPYLTAVINESLRLSYGTTQRSPRINRLHAMQYGDWVIPPGTAIGMDSYHMHTNPDVFPDPLVFRPERWLGNPKGPNGRQLLTNYLTSFGAGSRICVAMHLAYLEVFVALATIFRRHDLQLFETDLSDVEFALDMVAPMPHRESRGVRVTVSK
ncbi:cytochrome P450 [Amniculicola lignicola CBS 123094]|uniref:Cytochrome P450 n=1 Tax=Amniculicola lignicola CBS 123094 TaxID=1392246 RepID=A0A6A5VZT2_9PLEO|nr:cytochrome P450 [Amniculicola lignicola CBS 123094]